MRSVLELAATSFAPSRQHYDSLPAALLHSIFAQLRFKQKMTCEAVCSGWRSALRCPPLSDSRHPCDPCTAGVWGTLVICLQYDRPEITDDPPQIIEVSRFKTRIILSGPDDPFWQPDAGFVAWLRLRAALAQKLKLDNKAKHAVWAFSDLVLAIHDSCSFLPAPPLTLITGNSCLAICTALQRSHSTTTTTQCFKQHCTCGTGMLLLCFVLHMVACYANSLLSRCHAVSTISINV